MGVVVAFFMEMGMFLFSISISSKKKKNSLESLEETTMFEKMQMVSDCVIPMINRLRVVRCFLG